MMSQMQQQQQPYETSDATNALVSLKIIYRETLNVIRETWTILGSSVSRKSI